MQNPLKKIFKPRLKLEKGTRLTSFLFIATSIAIAAGILIAANIYYNIDTGEVVIEHVERVTNVIKAIGGLVAGGDTLTSGYTFEVIGESKLATTTIHSGSVLRLYNPANTAFVGFKAATNLSTSITYVWPGAPSGSGYVLTSDTSGNLSWVQAGTGGVGDVTAVGDCGSGDCFTPLGATSTTLWFRSGTYHGALTVGALTANATYTLPAVSFGTYYFALTSGTLGGANRITFATGDYTLGSSANLTWDSANNAIVVGTSGVRGQLRMYSGNTSNYLAFTPTNTLSASVIYVWPGPPTGSGYVLTSDTSGNLSWTQAGTGGIGDITAVGDCTSGDCFTQTGGSGNNLWFITGGGGRIQLTGASTAGNYTITLPAATGTVALGTGTTNYVAYWTGTNTLGAEQYLSVSRGGLGANVTPSSIGSLLYANTASSYAVLSPGTANQILTTQGAGNAPQWRNIADLIVATNGLTGSGTTQLTLKLGGALTESTTISLANYDLIFNLTGTGDFRVQDAGSDVFVISDDGRVFFKGTSGWPIAQTGKQILREVVPIFGFDLPVKTATTSYVKVSRDIVNYPLNPCEPGTSRVHKLVIRYGATATTSWQVATSSGAYTAFQLPPTTATSTGSVYTATTEIPVPSGSCTSWNQGTETVDWWVQTKLDASGELMIYQIFLAGYDQLL